MKNFKNLLLVALFFVTATMLGQKLSGTVVDETGQPLPGASVVEKGTTNGAATDFDGNFTINAKSSTGNLAVSFVGYTTKVVPFTKPGSLGKIQLSPSANTLDEVIIVGKGVVDLVKERETPVAVSTIKAEEIQEKIGNQEFPEILKATPSVYTTKGSGGFGDSRIVVRGFNQRNTAIIINGQPVNDMENGKVYWSNWSGLQDVASAVQIQRGLGASKLAVPSVGGTINVVTKSAEKSEGGFAKFSIGNDNFHKTVVSYNTGMNEKTGWSASVLFGRTAGDGYIDGTAFEGYNYFAALGYKMNEKHSFNLSLTGAGQWHNQRSRWQSLENLIKRGAKYNEDWGYLNGREYSIRQNFYSKPIASLNWDWDINEKLSLSTVLYGSWGRGGGTGPRGGGAYHKFRDANGIIDFDAVVANNQSGAVYQGVNSKFAGAIVGANNTLLDSQDAADVNEAKINGNVTVRRASMNSHDWYGGITNLKYELEDWTFGIGADLRTYQGYHYRVLNDLLGLDAYYSTGNKNIAVEQFYIYDKREDKYYSKQGGKFITQTIEAKPFKDTGLSSESKIDYYNIGKVNWAGTNAIIEYNNHENISAVLQGGISNQSYQRVDHFDQPNNEVSKVKDIVGGYVKGGVNYNIDETHNVFANSGLIKRQPNFDAVFPNYGNTVNNEVTNETIVSYELGYGYKSEFINANLNLYRSTWKDRWLTKSLTIGTDQGSANFPNIEQIHQGVELELTAKPIEGLKITVGGSYGDWRYGDNATATIFDENRNKLGEGTVYVKDVKIGHSAQFTGNLGAEYEFIENLKADVNWNYYGNLYADFNPLDSVFFKEGNKGALELPDYNLFDAGLSYKHVFTDKHALKFRINVNNVLDTKYISESNTNIHADASSSTYDGIDIQNKVWFGFGRTWNTSLTFEF